MWGAIASATLPPMDPGAPRLQVWLLGRFAVAVDGVELPPDRWPSLRSAQLVQLLSLQPGRRLSRDLVVDALWPALDAEAGGANLRKALHHARHALGRQDAVVQQSGELLLWPLGDLELDTERFEQCAALAARDAKSCGEALRLYAGDLLPGMRYEPWTEPARERLRATWLDLLRAAGMWEHLARLEPTDEGAHRALMLRELNAGQPAAAVRWYAHLREALQRQWGVLPSEATQTLYRRCTDGLQSTRAAFVGRADLLGQWQAWLDSPPERRHAGWVLRGPAGMGKTAACREWAGMAREQGWAVWRFSAADDGRPLGLMAEITEHLLLRDRSLLDRIGGASRTVLAQLSALAEPAQSPLGPFSRHQVVGAIRRLLLAAAGEAPALLLVDDAHLIGETDADVLLQLLATGSPLSLVLVVRPQPATSHLAQGLARLARAGELVSVELNPLNEDEARALLARGDPHPLDPSVCSRVLALAEGNPFALLALAGQLQAGSAVRLPASVADAITERLCDAPPEGRALLNWLALCADGADVRTMEALSALAGLPSLSAVDPLLADGTVELVDGRYRIRHALVRQALADQVPPHRQQQMHRQLAIRLAEMDGPAATVARHWVAAGRPREAQPFLLAAASQAMRLAAFRDALRHLDLLLAFQPDHAEGLRLRAEALDMLGQPAALAAYRMAAAVASEAERHNLLAKAALAQVKQGDPKGGLVTLQGLRPSSVEGLLSEALAYSGAAALGFADPAMGTAKSAQARRLALQSGDTASLVIASWAQAAAAHARGELHRSVWADLHDTRHVPHLALRVFDGHLCITQRFLYGARPYPEVIAFAQALADEAHALGAARGEAFGITLRGEAEWLAGDLVAAREHLQLGVHRHRVIGGAVGEALGLQRLAELALHEGNHDEARALIDDALDLARQTDIGFHLLDRIYGTRIQLQAHDPMAALHVLEDASESVRGPLETCPGCRITFAVPAAIAAARAGEVELARSHEAQCAYLANVVMRLPAWHAAHQEVQGHLLLAQGAPRDDALARFAAAAAGFRQAGQPLDAERCDAKVRGKG